jgi:alpha-1,6-mannosyltransferase
MVPVVFVLFGFARDARIRSIVWPAFSFVLLMSFLGHKEWRFIVYVVPMLNIAAAHGAQSLYVFPLFSGLVCMLIITRNRVRQRKGTLLGLTAFLAVVGALALNTAATVLLTRASMANYPGGHALARLNERFEESLHGRYTVPFPHTHLYALSQGKLMTRVL